MQIRSSRELERPGQLGQCGQDHGSGWKQSACVVHVICPLWKFTWSYSGQCGQCGQNRLARREAAGKKRQLRLIRICSNELLRLILDKRLASSYHDMLIKWMIQAIHLFATSDFLTIARAHCSGPSLYASWFPQLNIIRVVRARSLVRRSLKIRNLLHCKRPARKHALRLATPKQTSNKLMS